LPQRDGHRAEEKGEYKGAHRLYRNFCTLEVGQTIAFCRLSTAPAIRPSQKVPAVTAASVGGCNFSCRARKAACSSQYAHRAPDAPAAAKRKSAGFSHRSASHLTAVPSIGVIFFGCFTTQSSQLIVT
jgi:hypothetical protein